MQQISYKYADLGDAEEGTFALLCRHRGMLWGMLAGGPIGLATMINMSVDDPTLIVSGIAILWLAGGFCGHSMQSLLEGTR